MKSKEIKIKKTVIDKIAIIVSEFIKQNSDLAEVSADEFIDAFIAEGGEELVKKEFAKLKGHVNWSERQYKLLIVRALFEGVSEDCIEEYVIAHAEDFDSEGGTLEMPPTLEEEMLILGERKLKTVTEDGEVSDTCEDPTIQMDKPEPEDTPDKKDSGIVKVHIDEAVLRKSKKAFAAIESLGDNMTHREIQDVLRKYYPKASDGRIRITTNVLYTEIHRKVFPKGYLESIIRCDLDVG